ncbi:MAG: efflux RND transporter permease subunit [Pseudomonadota bacterium]
MTGLVDWCAERARMVVVVVLVSLAAGWAAYTALPKEGAPDIDIPVLYISVPVSGISSTDAERLVVKPLEQELRGLEGLKEITGIAAEGYGAVLLEFDFDWDQAASLAKTREKVDRARAEFPDDAEEPFINEVNLSQFPIVVVSLSGEVPERTLFRLASDLQRTLEANPAVLSADFAGHREEMVEVLVDPLKLESYGLTAEDLLSAVSRNSRLVAADSLESGTAAFSVTVPGAFERYDEVADLPIKVNGDRIVRLSDLAEIRRTFEDAEGIARYNGARSVSLQISKRLGENIIDTVAGVRQLVEARVATWPEPLQLAVSVDYSMDESAHVAGMVTQLEAAVLTAVLLVMMVVLATLGLRSAMLVGLAIPCSFLLSFGLMAVLGMGVNTMTMFGLILAVGMLVDGAIVVVEYADRRIREGEGPMRAYALAARRMFWPITASTATTLCAFMPMLLWPGIPGEFMGQLPITLIFVLSASLIVALIYLPVLGGIAARITRTFARPAPPPPPRQSGTRTRFGRIVALIATNPLGPVVALGLTLAAVAGTFAYYGQHQNGVEFFVETEPERAIVHVRARGNPSLAEKDRLVRAVEARLRGVEGIASAFAFSGEGGLVRGPDSGPPSDSIGQIQIELERWDSRRPGREILAEIEGRLAGMPGIITEIAEEEDGPQQGKPVQLRLSGSDWPALLDAATTARARFDTEPGLVEIDDTRPLPGIEWRIEVDRAAAGRFGADIASIGPMVQLVTRGALIDVYRPEDADEEIKIRARFGEEARALSTLDTLRLPTAAGLVPLSAFVERTPHQKLEEINRADGERYLMVRADVGPDVSDVGMIETLERWIAEERPFPESVEARFTGDREEQQESLAFLGQAFAGALALMFVILLAQFNSLYNAILVLSAVVLSVAGVLVGMLVMGQKFSIIMTGTGIVALAGIVVNNNIVLIDTYQEYCKRMDPLEAVIRTAEDRLRPVLLTTITTIAGLAPMMFAVSLDFARGEVVWGAPTALWWVQLATAVVFGLGTATALTLLATPAALALRTWIQRGAYRGARLLWESAVAAFGQRGRPYWRDRRLARTLAEEEVPEILWDSPEAAPRPVPVLRAAE